MVNDSNVVEKTMEKFTKKSPVLKAGPESWVSKLKRGVKSYFASQKKTTGPATKSIRADAFAGMEKDTARTAGIKQQLRDAGLTEEEINHLQGK